MRRIFLVTLAIFSISTSTFAVSNEELWIQAIDYYDTGEYEQARENYEKLIEREIISPELYYNLGNIYFKTGDLGYSIWSFRKALKLNPGLEQAKSNLEYVRTFNIDQIEKNGASFISDIWSFLANLLSYNAFLLLLFLSWWVSAAILVIIILKRNFTSWPYYLLMVSVIVAIFSATAAYSRIQNDRLAKWGVVINEVVDINDGPGADFNRIEIGHEGMEFKIISTRENSYLIELGNGLKGWIKKEAAIEI